MKEQFVTYEEALELKKKGFNEPCLGYYFKDKLFYDRAPYAYNGDDHFNKLGFTAITQVMGNYEEACLAPLKQQAYAFNNNIPSRNKTTSQERTIVCKKDDVIIIKIE